MLFLRFFGIAIYQSRWLLLIDGCVMRIGINQEGDVLLVSDAKRVVLRLRSSIT
jgi:hypothetical protein